MARASSSTCRRAGHERAAQGLPSRRGQSPGWRAGGGHAGCRIAVSGLVAIVLTAGCATSGGSASASPPPAIAPTTGADFCSEAQRIVANSRVPAVNTVFADREAFIRSKASARPLETRQYAAPEAGPGSSPKMVSCKMKTADHIRTEFGADQAGADETCALLNQRTLDAVLAYR